MNEKKEMLVSLVNEHNVSAIITMSEKLKIEPEEVVELINELLSEGKLQGTITEDNMRFFKSDAKVSDAPVIEHEEKLPEFLTYDTRPGFAISIFGVIVLVGGSLVSIYASDTSEQDFAAGLFLIGLLIMFGGLYLVAKHKTPD
ncbi:MAG: hypothetical protein IH631_06475 [Candidatus Thorarchaeota archaeon]|nr:hypothetical protein [Candidatus Thorarchaeota archaeon]